MPFLHSKHLRSVGPKSFGVARQIAGAATNDAGPFNFASYAPNFNDTGAGSDPPDGTPVSGAFLGGAKHETLLVAVSYTGAGTLRIQPRIPDMDLELWVPFLDGAGIAVQSPEMQSLQGGGGVWVCPCYGNRLFFFVQDLSGEVTDLEIIVRPGKPLVAPFFP